MDSTDEKGACVRPYVRMHAEDNVKSGSSDPDYTSSSEQSCDTVIYVGNLTHNDRDFTDNEGPPSALPIVPKTKQSQPQSKSSHTNETVSTLERKRHNSFSKTQSGTDDQRRSEEKSPSVPHASTADTGTHHSCTTKTSKTDKTQITSKNSPLLQRHQPASTQTLQTESTSHNKSAQNSPIHTQKKTKHRTSQSKQDQSTDAEQSASGSKGQVAGKGSKPQSDETWIDGPRFVKPKFDSKTLHQLQKEQWVDGPPNMYGFMDHHKQNMIQRWIEEHSRQIQSTTKKKSNEVWIDYPPDGIENSSSTREIHKSLSDVSNLAGSKEDKSCVKDRKTSGVGCSSHKTEPQKTLCTSESISFPLECENAEDEADSASNSADVDETDNEENAEASGYDSDLHILQIGQSEMQYQSLHMSLCSKNLKGDLDEGIETIEVTEPDEPVPMVDSCLQVTEEDIIAEYWMQCRRKSSENPLPEVDQSSCDSKEHPLRILSEEDLNLPSSFTDSRSVSVDLDSISVPDTCREGVRGKGAVTWRLLYGNMFQRIKEQQQQRQRRTIEDLTSVSNSEINDKLERIAKLRELIQPLTRHRNQTQIESIFKTCPVTRLTSSGSRYTMSEMLCASTDSSMEDLSAAEVTSTQSEPADLDIDKYDYKLNIKPMNGLKLEAFYKKIHKVPPFLEQYSSIKPTQVVPPLAYEHDNAFLLKKEEIQRSEDTEMQNSSSYKQLCSASSQKPVIEGFRQDENSAKLQANIRQTSSVSHIHKPTSTSNLQKESTKLSSSENITSNKTQKFNTETSLDDKKSLDRKDSKKSTEINDTTKRNDTKNNSRNISCKGIDLSQLTVGQSPSISSKSRTHRGKSKMNDIQSIHSQQPLTQSSSSSLWSKDSSVPSSPAKVPHRTGTHTSSSIRSPNKCHISNGNGNNKVPRTINNGACKHPARSSPTSSSTSGITTMCCSTMKQKDKTFSPKCKPFSSHSKQKQSIQDSRRSQRTKSICRSTSSPSTCADSGDTALTDFTDSEHYHVVRHASVSGTLASPYYKVPQVHVSHHHHHHHHRTSSGHGSESSVNSIEPREAKELLLKGAKTQQFSGTSSGYESMLRDSEGTPLSSSQESGNEDTMDKGERGRKGRRKSQGSSKRSLSAPARSPPSPTGPSPSTAISQQPLTSGRGCRRGDRSLHRSDEEVCCTSLLCCRLLDFY
ncbi:Kinesin-like protein KIF26A, partial [Stegodyphus mimosarum]